MTFTAVLIFHQTWRNMKLWSEFFSPLPILEVSFITGTILHQVAKEAGQVRGENNQDLSKSKQDKCPWKVKCFTLW